MYEIIDNYRTFAEKEHQHEKEQSGEIEQPVETEHQEPPAPIPEVVEEPTQEEGTTANQASEETKENPPAPTSSDLPETVQTVDDIYDFDGLSGLL